MTKPDPDIFEFLGNGWDSLEGSSRNEIVTFTHNTTATTSECNIYKCESIEDIVENLHIGRSGSVDSPLTTAQFKASFLKECSKKSNAITLLVKVRRTWEAVMQNAVFTQDDDISPIYEDASKLLQYAGDSYISQVEVGAEYYAAYQFHASTLEQKQNIADSIDSKFGAIVTIGSHTSAQIEEITNASKSTYTFIQSLIGSDEKLPDPNHAINFALELTAREIPKPQVLSFKTTPYSILPNGPSGLSDADKWINAYMKPTPGWYPYSVKAIVQQARFVLGRSQAALTLYRFYDAQSGLRWKLLTHCDGCSRIIDDLERWKRNLIERLSTGNWEEGPQKPEFNIDFLSVPHPQFDRTFGDAWGRLGGGSPWFDFDDEMVYSFGYPKTFRCKGHLVLDSLTTVYGYRNPEDPDNREDETLHEITNGGGGGGDVAFNYTFSPGQVRYTGIWSKASKTSGESDRDLARNAGLVCGFEAYVHGDSKNKMMGRPDGPWKGNEVPENSFFLGFQGRSGYQIDVLQPVYVNFKELKWVPSLPRTQTEA